MAPRITGKETLTPDLLYVDTSKQSNVFGIHDHYCCIFVWVVTSKCNSQLADSIQNVGRFQNLNSELYRLACDENIQLP